MLFGGLSGRQCVWLAGGLPGGSHKGKYARQGRAMQGKAWQGRKGQRRAYGMACRLKVKNKSLACRRNRFYDHFQDHFHKYRWHAGETHFIITFRIISTNIVGMQAKRILS